MSCVKRPGFTSNNLMMSTMSYRLPVMAIVDSTNGGLRGSPRPLVWLPPSVMTSLHCHAGDWLVLYNGTVAMQVRYLHNISDDDGIREFPILHRFDINNSDDIMGVKLTSIAACALSQAIHECSKDEMYIDFSVNDVVKASTIKNADRILLSRPCDFITPLSYLLLPMSAMDFTSIGKISNNVLASILCGSVVICREEYVSILGISLNGTSSYVAATAIDNSRDINKNTENQILRICPTTSIECSTNSSNNFASIRSPSIAEWVAAASVRGKIVEINTVMSDLAHLLWKAFKSPTPNDHDSIVGTDNNATISSEFNERKPCSPAIDNNLNVSPPFGVLVHGPPGTGKSVTVAALLEVSGLPCIRVNAPDVFSTNEGDSERTLLAICESARIQAPCVMIIEEIETLCPERKLCGPAGPKNGGVEHRLTILLSDFLDGVRADVIAGVIPPVFVIGITSRILGLDSSIRRPGRLGVDVPFPIPSPTERLLMLRHLSRSLLDGVPDMKRDPLLKDIADSTHGFAGADLLSLCREATMNAARRTNGNETFLSKEDFDAALCHVRPAALSDGGEVWDRVKGGKGIGGKRPSLDDLVGMDDLLSTLRASVLAPLTQPALFTSVGVSSPRGILIYGPAGTGKTTLAVALAVETGLNVICVEASQVRSKLVGESEKILAELFKRARESSPCILLIDQLEILAPRRCVVGSESAIGNHGDRLLTCLLTEMDGLLSSSINMTNVIVLATASRLEKLDNAILRPGRLDQHIFIPLPDTSSRFTILRHYLQCSDIDDETLEQFASKTKGASGADLRGICNEAAMGALRENIAALTISVRHLEIALQSMFREFPTFIQ